MWRRVKNNLDSGIDKIKWFSSVLAERMKVEFSVIKLLQEREKKEKDRAEKMRLVGERVFELRNHSEKNAYKDKAISEAIVELERLDAEIEEIKKKASEMSNIEG
ncbi:MAG: hypothetical protein EPN94_01720 [Nitrospirae bacterium]|nr:MAG: hypothetical protein EPN94_01720 [Nitrospirota bacterium]